MKSKKILDKRRPRPASCGCDGPRRVPAGSDCERILSMIFGTLLGDSQTEKIIDFFSRPHQVKTRIIFQQEDSNMEYLTKFWKDISKMGYCSNGITKPKFFIKIGKGGRIRRYYKFNTKSLESFNWIYEMWYDENNIKHVPKEIGKYLTPEALAYWIMHVGQAIPSGILLNTTSNSTRGKDSNSMSKNSFTLEDLQLLCSVLKEKYNLTCTILNADAQQKSNNIYRLHISKESIFEADLIGIVRPYMLESMFRKLF